VKVMAAPIMGTPEEVCASTTKPARKANPARTFWLLPERMVRRASAMGFAATGVVRSVVLASPNCPLALLPQPRRLPSLSSARLYESPAAMATALLMPGTCTGVS
jgi:hypothetical protein